MRRRHKIHSGLCGRQELELWLRILADQLDPSPWLSSLSQSLVQIGLPLNQIATGLILSQAARFCYRTRLVLECPVLV